jgi:hypothetical protein
MEDIDNESDYLYIKTISNQSYRGGYSDGYRRGQMANNITKFKNNDFNLIPYFGVTYYTTVISLLGAFIAFVIVALHLNRLQAKPYDKSCLTKI